MTLWLRTTCSTKYVYSVSCPPPLGTWPPKHRRYATLGPKGATVWSSSQTKVTRTSQPLAYPTTREWGCSRAKCEQLLPTSTTSTSKGPIGFWRLMTTPTSSWRTYGTCCHTMTPVTPCTSGITLRSSQTRGIWVGEQGTCSVRRRSGGWWGVVIRTWRPPVDAGAGRRTRPWGSASGRWASRLESL